MSKQDSLPISALVSLGLEFSRHGDLVGAECQYLAILARVPKHADALHLLGVLKGQQGKHAVGVDLIHKAIDQSPRVSTYHNNLGNLLLQSGDRLSAEKSYRRALRFDRDDADASLKLGKLLHENGSTVEARRCLKIAERLAPGSVETHMSVGRLEEQTGNLEVALESYRRAARLAPGFAAAALAQSNVLLRLKKDADAEEVCRLAVALDPESADAQYNLGNLLRRQGQLGRGRALPACDRPGSNDLVRRVHQLGGHVIGTGA